MITTTTDPQGTQAITDITTVVNGSNVTVTWNTSAPADSEIDYGLVTSGSFATRVRYPGVVAAHSLSLSELAQGSYQFIIRSTFADGAVVGADNGGGGFIFNILIGPKVTEVASSFNPLTRLLTVTWTTDVPADSRMDVGISDYAVTAQQAANVTAHSISVQLCGGGSYRFRVVSADANANVTTDDNDSAGYPANVPTSAGVGTTGSPFFICTASMPVQYADNRNTASSVQSAIAKYAPAPQNEAGPEYIYTFTLTAQATLSATIANGIIPAGVDVDLQLLSAVNPVTLEGADDASKLLSRNDKSLTSITLAAGTYWLSLDTFGTDASKAGAYALTVSLSADAPVTPAACTYATRPTPNGVPPEVADAARCPAGMVMVDTFCVDKYEAMLVGIDSAGHAFPWSPYSNPGTQKVKALSVAGAVPQGYISRDEAASACTQSGKHLCDSSEWLRACRGPTSTVYPYGNTRETGVCNDSRSQHPAVEYYGTSASWVYSHLDNPCFNQEPSSEDNAGARSGCATAENAFDMMGNLHEWVADTQSNGNGIFRGGYYMDTTINGNGCLYATTAHAPSYWDYSTGFRCCAAAAP